MVKLSKGEIFAIYEALSMSYGFYSDSDRQDDADRIKQVLDLFHYVKNANVELTPGDGDDGGNIERINEILKQRQLRLEKKDTGNVLTFPGRL